MTGKLVVLHTCGSEEEAETIAKLLVNRRLAACVNILAPIRSIYRWQGAVEESREWLLLIKVAESQFEEVTRAVKEAHSYEVPELIALPITHGSPDYLNWMQESLIG